MSGTPVGLDFEAVMGLARAQGADLELLALALPEIEIAILSGMNGEGEDE